MTNFSVAGLLQYKFITLVRITAMLENIQDPRAARWNRMHE